MRSPFSFRTRPRWAHAQQESICSQNIKVEARLLEPAQWNRAQWEAVNDAFVQHFKQSAAAGNPLVQYVDWDAAYKAIDGGDVRAVIVDGYLIVYDMGTPWYSSVPLLFEQMVLRLEVKSGNYRVVIKALDQLAARHKCGAVIAGNAVGRKALTRAYERAGFKTIATQLHKGV